MKKLFALLMVLACVFVTGAAFAEAETYAPGDALVLFSFDGSNLKDSEYNSIVGTNKSRIEKLLKEFDPKIKITYYDALSELSLENYKKDIADLPGGEIMPYDNSGSNNEITTPGIFALVHTDDFSADALVKYLRPMDSVAAADLNYYQYPYDVEPNDPAYKNYLWGLQAINAPYVWTYATGSSDVYVAVIDTGFDKSHPDLYPNIDAANSKNFASGVSPTDYYTDYNGHGTHVMGTVGAMGNDKFGVVGVNWNTKLLALRVAADKSGVMYDNAIIGALNHITYCVNNKKLNIAAVNLSLGSYDSLTPAQMKLTTYYQAFVNVDKLGVLICVAAGNENNDVSKPMPSNGSYGSTKWNAGDYSYCSSFIDLDNFIVVGSAAYNPSTKAITKSNFSNWGSNTVHIAAPGSSILSTRSSKDTSSSVTVGGDSRFTYKSGTSMATPHVAGAVGLLKSAFPDASSQEIKNALFNGANHRVCAGTFTRYGFLDLKGAYDILSASNDLTCNITIVPSTIYHGGSPDTATVAYGSWNVNGTAVASSDLVNITTAQWVKPNGTTIPLKLSSNTGSFTVSTASFDMPITGSDKYLFNLVASYKDSSGRHSTGSLVSKDLTVVRSGDLTATLNSTVKSGDIVYRFGTGTTSLVLNHSNWQLGSTNLNPSQVSLTWKTYRGDGVVSGVPVKTGSIKKLSAKSLSWKITNLTNSITKAGGEKYTLIIDAEHKDSYKKVHRLSPLFVLTFTVKESKASDTVKASSVSTSVSTEESLVDTDSTDSILIDPITVGENTSSVSDSGATDAQTSESDNGGGFKSAWTVNGENNNVVVGNVSNAQHNTIVTVQAEPRATVTVNLASWLTDKGSDGVVVKSRNIFVRRKGVETKLENVAIAEDGSINISSKATGFDNDDDEFELYVRETIDENGAISTRESDHLGLIFGAGLLYAELTPNKKDDSVIFTARWINKHVEVNATTTWTVKDSDKIIARSTGESVTFTPELESKYTVKALGTLATETGNLSSVETANYDPSAILNSSISSSNSNSEGGGCNAVSAGLLLAIVLPIAISKRKF